MRRIGTLAIVLGAALLVACGGEEEASMAVDSPEAGASTSLEDSDEPMDAARSAGQDAAIDDASGALQIRYVNLDPSPVKPGDTVRARVSVESGDNRPYELSYTWEIGGHRIQDNLSSITLPTSARKGTTFRVQVRASDDAGNAHSAFAEGRIANSPPTIYELQLEETPDSNEWMARVWARDSDRDELEYEYSWLVNDRVIENEGPTLSTSTLKRGDRVRVRVIARDGADESAPAETGTIEVANASPEITSLPPRLDASGKYVYSIEAHDSDGDSTLRYELVKGPSGMQVDALTGVVRWEPTAEHAGDNPVEVAVLDGNGGRATQEFNIPIVVHESYDDAPPARSR